MAKESSIKFQTAKKYNEKFEKTPTLTLARKLYKENKALYKNVEDARAAIRYYRGQIGNKLRKTLSKATGSEVEEPKYNYTPFKIPESDAESWEKFQLPVNDYNLLILSDIHFPYHDKRALEIALDYGLKNGCTHLLLNGDIFDCYQMSRFDKDPRKRHFADELNMVRDFLKQCASAFKHVYWKNGNHDERFEKYMMIKAPELLDLPEFRLEEMLHCGELGVHYITDKRIIDVGHLSIIHGHEFLGATSQAVNPARGLYLKTSESCIIGHLHKSSSHTEKTLSGKIITTWSTGCLCDMHPEYARINKWNLGFAIVEVKKNGTYRVHNKSIYNNSVL